MLRSEVIVQEAGEEYGVIDIDSCTPREDIKEIMFEDEGSMVPMKLQFYDIPLLHTNCREGINFIFALHEQNNVDIYALKSI